MQCPECHSEDVQADASNAGVAHCDNCGAIIDRRRASAETSGESRVGGPKSQAAKRELQVEAVQFQPGTILGANGPDSPRQDTQTLTAEEILVEPEPGWRPAKLREALVRIRGIAEAIGMQSDHYDENVLAVVQRIDAIAAEALAGER